MSLLACLKQCDGGSAAFLPKALKRWPQINAFTPPEWFLAAKGTARPLIALLSCCYEQEKNKTKTKPSV